MTLKKGLNQLQFKRERLQGVDFNSLAFVDYQPTEDAVLYLDNVRTWEYQQQLDERGKMDIVYADSVVSPHLVLPPGMPQRFDHLWVCTISTLPAALNINAPTVTTGRCASSNALPRGRR